MAQTHPTITPDLHALIMAQPLFFVATAPLAADGHINISPKGLDCFQILGPLQVAYLDLTGSGNETSAHIAENGRITFMFCTFTGAPKIVRLYGHADAILPHDAAWPELRPLFPAHPGARQIIRAEINRVQTSCGFGVPLMEYVGQRDTLPRWAEAKGDAGLAVYRQQKNLRSIDDLPTALATATVQDNS